MKTDEFNLAQSIWLFSSCLDLAGLIPMQL